MQRPSPGTIIAVVALFVALGGTAVAVDGVGSAKVQVHNLNLKNGWTKYGGDSLPPRYFKVGDVVHLEGAIYGGTTSGVAFKLPDGARPAGELRFAVAAGPGYHDEVVIRENGAGYVDDYSGTADSFTGLDGISFRAK